MNDKLVDLVNRRKQEANDQVRMMLTPEQRKALELAGRYASLNAETYTIPYRTQAPSNQFGMKALNQLVKNTS